MFIIWYNKKNLEVGQHWDDGVTDTATTQTQVHSTTVLCHHQWVGFILRLGILMIARGPLKCQVAQ